MSEKSDAMACDRTVPSTATPPSRREFLTTTAAVAATTAVAAPTIVPSSVFAKAGQPAPSDRVVIGCIGVGDLGRRHHLGSVLLSNNRVRVAAVCDVDANHRDMAAADVFRRTGQRVGAYSDFRDLLDQPGIDAVLVCTPDHWHALASIAAMEAGKDVYCEKPLTLTIAEGRHMVQTARRYGTVFQTGSQQRSSKQFRLACELVRNGKIGKLSRVDTRIGGVDSGRWQAATTPPPNLDWNMWLGPAPYVDYRPNQVHYQFRWFSDYSGGKMTDWGAHHNDITQWALDADASGPVKVKALSAEFHPDGPHDVAGNFEVLYTYANGVELYCHSKGENGVLFTGSEGTIFVSRGRIEVKVGKETFTDKPKDGQGDVYKAFPLGSMPVKLYESANHHNNWLDCIASRAKPICDVEIGHRSATVCHLGNIAIRSGVGRELCWDPQAEQFVGDAVANRLTSKPMRAPWHL